MIPKENPYAVWIMGQIDSERELEAADLFRLQSAYQAGRERVGTTLLSALGVLVVRAGMKLERLGMQLTARSVQQHVDLEVVWKAS